MVPALGRLEIYRNDPEEEAMTGDVRWRSGLAGSGIAQAVGAPRARDDGIERHENYVVPGPQRFVRACAT